jgi:hypothetical protein
MQREANHLAQWPNYELEKLIVKKKKKSCIS